MLHLTLKRSLIIASVVAASLITCYTINTLFNQSIPLTNGAGTGTSAQARGTAGTAGNEGRQERAGGGSSASTPMSATVPSRSSSSPASSPSPAASPSSASASPSEDAGQKAVLANTSARIAFGGKEMGGLVPDDMGMFPRVNIQASEEIAIRMNIPGGTPGQLLAVQTVDGGTVANQKMAAYVPLEKDNTLPFTFKAGTQAGVYRIEVRAGEESRNFDFWIEPRD